MISIFFVVLVDILPDNPMLLWEKSSVVTSCFFNIFDNDLRHIFLRALMALVKKYVIKGLPYFSRYGDGVIVMVHSGMYPPARVPNV